MKPKPQVKPDTSNDDLLKQGIMPAKHIKLIELKQQVAFLAEKNMDQSFRILKKWIHNPEA